jgi:hypothetical protein
LIAPYWLATLVISRITDSVNVFARAAVATRLEIDSVADTQTISDRPPSTTLLSHRWRRP